MIDNILSIFREDPLRTSYETAVEDFKKRKQEEIKEVRRESERLISETEEAVGFLDEELKRIDEDDRSYDRDVIEDVMNNVMTKRRRDIDDLEIPDDPVELCANLEEFIERFQDMSQKEQAVMNEVRLPDEFYEALENLQTLYGDLEKFLNSEYTLLENYRDLQNAVSERQENLETVEDLRTEVESLKVKELEERKDELTDEIEELKQGPSWEEYEELKQELEDAKGKREKRVQEVSHATSRAERGVKKIVYEAKNGELTVGADTRVLENIRDADANELLRESERVEAASKSLKQELPDDVPEGKDREKLKDALDKLVDITEISDEVESLQKRIESLEEEVDKHDAAEKKRQLEEEKSDVQDQLDEEYRKRDELQKRVEKNQETIRELEEEIERLLDESIDGEVKVDDMDVGDMGD